MPDQRPQDLLSIDALVFSSHKTATQTLVRSLKVSGIRAAHCHVPNTIGIASGELARALEEYAAINGRPLRIISTFREPMGRMISSFFQWHGVGVVRNGFVPSVEETIVFRKAPADLREDFIAFLARYDGFGESLRILATELGQPVGSLRFDEAAEATLNELPRCDLWLTRFDLLTADFLRVGEKVAGRALRLSTDNLAEEQWYADRRDAFVAELRLPRGVIEELYASRRDLVDVFYPGRSGALLRAALDRFAA